MVTASTWWCLLWAVWSMRLFSWACSFRSSPPCFIECRLSDHIPSAPKQTLLPFVENPQQKVMRLLPSVSGSHLSVDNECNLPLK